MEPYKGNTYNELPDPHGDKTRLTQVKGGRSAATSAGSGGEYGEYQANQIVVRSTI